ncbi:MAG: hypothetical protein ACLT46_07610 [Hungatella sp.]
MYDTQDNADETSYEALTKYLAGDISGMMNFSTHKLLKNDMEAVTKLKKALRD